MTSAQQRYQAVESALANNRLSGFVPSSFGASIFTLWIEGALTTEQAIERIVGHYKASEVADSDDLAEPNKLGITDSGQLRRFEADVTTLRMAELSVDRTVESDSSDTAPIGFDPKALELLDLGPTPMDIERKALFRELQAMQGPDPTPSAVLGRFLTDREAFFDQVRISESQRRLCVQMIRGGYIAGDWIDLEQLQLIAEIARFRMQRQAPLPLDEPPHNSLKSDAPPPAPDGYATWLDYAVLTMDTRGPSLEHMFDDDYEPPDREAMRQAVLAELRELRALAAQAGRRPPAQTSP